MLQMVPEVGGTPDLIAHECEAPAPTSRLWTGTSDSTLLLTVQSSYGDTLCGSVTAQMFEDTDSVVLTH